MTERVRVLIVDDDPFVRRLIALTLHGVGGVEITQAGDGAEAVERAREVAPALVLLDVHMPHVDGIEACRRLRALEAAEGERREHAQIVMLSAAEPALAAAARQAGADDFLAKPFSPRELLALVERAAA